jgi:hypothetical protein
MQFKFIIGNIICRHRNKGYIDEMTKSNLSKTIFKLKQELSEQQMRQADMIKTLQSIQEKTREKIKKQRSEVEETKVRIKKQRTNNKSKLLNKSHG